MTKRQGDLVGYEQCCEEIAIRSIRELGFIVVPYLPGKAPSIGDRVRILWRHYVAPQPFIVVRKATKKEWEAQLAVVDAVLGFPVPRVVRRGTQWVLTTD